MSSLWNIEDRWLWVGFAWFFVIAYPVIQYSLTLTVSLQPFEDDDPSTNLTPTRPEDSISLTTLATLVKSPNTDIADSATDILLQRFISTPTENKAWVDDLFSPNSTVRTRASQLLRLYDAKWLSFPLGSPSRHLRALIDISVGKDDLAARTVRLAYGHARATEATDEGRAMTLLGNLAEGIAGSHDRSVILLPEMREDQVLLWLDAMHQRLVMGYRPDSDRWFLRSVRKLCGVDDEDDVGGEVIGVEIEEVEGNDGDEDDDLPDEVAFELGMGAVGSSGLRRVGWEDVVRRPRFHEESFEETEIRRRRREAMVLHEGDGALDRGDIIQSVRTRTL